VSIKALPHFYWTKKKITSSQEILSNAKSNGIILDPFMGSGQSLFGIDLDRYKFIGIELNEMPIKMLEKYLFDLNEENLKKATDFLYELQDKYKEVYELNCPSCGNKISYNKVIFDRDVDSILIKDMKFKCDCCNYMYDNEEYNKNINQQYIDKMALYKRKNQVFKDLELIPNSRIAIKKDMYISDLFSPMNFFILQNMKENDEIKYLIEYIISSVLHLIKYTDTKSQSQFPFWIPKVNILDRNIFNQFISKAKELKKFTIDKKSYSAALNFEELKDNQLLLLHGAAQDKLKEIPDNSIDILFTDPPYYDQVAYSEYLITWNFFLNFKIDYEKEIVVSNREYKAANRDDYLKNIKNVFEISYRKLKDNGEVFIYFKDSKQNNYLDFINILVDIGFVYEKQFHLNKSRITYKQNNTKKTTSRGDCIIYFKKDEQHIVKEKQSFNKIDFLNYIYELIYQYLLIHKKTSTGELLDNIIYKEMILNKINEKINEKDIVKFLEERFNYENGEWIINE